MSGTDSIFVAKIRSSEEWGDCCVIRKTVFVEEQKVPLEFEFDEYDDTALHFLARQNKAPIGTARVLFKDEGKTAKIGRVAVLQQSRGLGIGHAIMQCIEADPEVRQASKFFLEAQTYTLAFYEKLGYAAHGDEYLDCGIPHRFMSKKNPNPAAVLVKS